MECEVRGVPCPQRRLTTGRSAFQCECDRCREDQPVGTTARRDATVDRREQWRDEAVLGSGLVVDRHLDLARCAGQPPHEQVRGTDAQLMAVVARPHGQRVGDDQDS